MGTSLNLTGQVFGRLTVIDKNGSNGKRSLWRCSCFCGNEHIVTSDGLKSGKTKSCGCYDAERLAERSTTHGLRKHPLYTTWQNIKKRCSNPKSTQYKWYGGRGITVCQEWKNDFKAFYDWCMANGWKKGLTIDRINNDGNYEPSNCRWITHKENCQNRPNLQPVTATAPETTEVNDAE